MKILSSIFFLFCFSAYSLSAQDLTISVRIGGESAEYAFVYLNENCIGNCDSTGFFVLRSSEYKTGDVLYATMAGIASNHLTICSGEESVALQLSSNEIVASAIEVDAISRWDEYYKLVRKKFVEFRLSKKYSFDYIIEKYDKSNNLEMEKTGSESIVIIKNNPIEGGVCREISLREQSDSIASSFSRKNIWDAYVYLFRQLDHRKFQRLAKGGKMYIHKYYIDGKPSFVFAEKENECNHTRVDLNMEEDKIIKIVREYYDERGAEHYILTINTKEDSSGYIYPLDVCYEFRLFNGNSFLIATNGIQRSDLTKTDKAFLKRKLKDERILE